MLLFACIFLFAIALAESSSPRGSRVPSRRYVFSALAASLVCLGLMAVFSDYVRMPPREEYRGRAARSVGTPEARQKLYAILGLGLCDGVLHAWLATFIYVHLRNSRLAGRELAKVQLRQAEANRKLLASQLASTRAEVDPDAILATLEAIQSEYEIDSAGAAARMDQLIGFLRAAIPRLRTPETLEVP